MDIPNRLLTTDEMARIVPLSRRVLRDLARDGRVPAYRLGHIFLFDANEVLEHARRTATADESQERVGA